MKWVAKVAAQHILGWTPGAHRLEELARARVTRTTRMDSDSFRFRLRWGPLRYLETAVNRFGYETLPSRFHYDVGAGWLPIVPFLFHAAGFGRQRLMDVERHLELDGCRTVSRALRDHRRYLADRLPSIPLEFQEFPAPQVSPTATDADALDAALARMGIEYSVPEDVTALPLPDGSVDMLTCTGVLAYLSPQELDGALREFRRVVVPDGLIGLYVHLVDDFATFDRSLPSFHFLRYEDRFWDRWICSKRFYNNRLRMQDYFEAFRKHGFETIVSDHEPPTAADLEALRRMPLAERFRTRDPAELGVRRFLAVLRP